MVKHEEIKYERPPRGVAVEEPTYKTCLVRITDSTQNMRHNYSRRQSFNADSSYFFVHSNSGWWYLYNAKTGEFIKRLNGPAGGAAEPQWDPMDPNMIYYFTENGVGMKIYRMDVRSNESVIQADMSDAIRAIWPKANVATTLKGEGSPSKDGRYWCLLARNTADTNEHGVWKSYGAFTWDLQERRIIGSMNLTDQFPDHISTSPSGRYCVISSDNPEMGTRAYHSDFRTGPYSSSISTNYLKVHPKSEHSDLGITKEGRDAYISVDYTAEGNGYVFFVDLETGQRTNLFRIYGAGGAATALHISAKNFDKPGWALFSSYSNYGGEVLWAYRKIFAFSLEDKPQIKNIAFSHAIRAKYEDEPQATTNKDFTRILFNSTWDSNNTRDRNVYMIGLPENAVPSLHGIGGVATNNSPVPTATSPATPQSGNPFVNRAQNAANQLQQAQQNQNNLLTQINGISVKAMKNADGSLTVAKEAAKPVIIDGASQFKTPKELQQLIDEAAAKGASAVLLKISGPDNYVLESELLGQTLATAQRDRDGIYAGAAGNNFYSRAQIGELENYARRQGIELIPEVNLPGQADFISKLLKRKDSDRAEQVFNGQTGEAAARFAQDLYGEVANAFGQSKHFHMGGAAFDSIVADNASYINFVNGNGKFLASRGLTPQLWNDGLLPGSLNKLDKAIEVGYRLEDGQRASKEALETAGFKVIDQREEQAPQ